MLVLEGSVWLKQRYFTRRCNSCTFFFPTGGTVIGQASRHPRIMVRSRKLGLRWLDLLWSFRWLVAHLWLFMTCGCWHGNQDWRQFVKYCTENLSLPSASVTAHPEMRSVDVSQRVLKLYSGNERSEYPSSFVANVQNRVKIHNVHNSSTPPTPPPPIDAGEHG